MRIRLSLTTSADPDLIMLYNCPSFDFKAWTQYSLGYYAKTGDFLKTPLPELSTPSKCAYKSVMVSISISDTITIAWIDALSRGVRSTVIKSVLRFSLESPCICAFMEKKWMPPEPILSEEKTWRTILPISTPAADAVSETPLIYDSKISLPTEETSDFDVFGLNRICR